jgi:fluoroacetyl-CoA thioesterase
MKSSLQPGLSYEFKFKVTEYKTVPYLFPESPEFQDMPKVLATGLWWDCLNGHVSKR